MPRIISLVTNLGLLEEFKSIVKGCSDSLHISKKTLTDRKKQKKKFSVQALATDFLPNESTAGLHNAVNDVYILLKLLREIRITDDVIKTHSKTIDEILMAKERKNAESINKSSLQIYKKKISERLLNKLAKAGINKQILQQTFKKNGQEGIHILFGESVNGKPRITTNKKILNNIYDLLSNDDSATS